LSAIMVTRAAAVKFTKLTPRQIKPINFSGSFSSFSSIFADLFPFLTWFFSLYLLRRMSAVSVPEKKADKKRSNNKMLTKEAVDRSSPNQ